MTEDDIIRTSMAAAGMLLEDLSAKLILDPLDDDLPSQLRIVAKDLENLANIVDAVRRAGRTAR